MQIKREQKTSRDYACFKITGRQASLKALSNQDLLSQTKSLVQKEREAHIQVLRHLREIEARKLYFSQGFSSLFDYAVRELGYSEGAAFRRIKAMRLCRDLPEAEERLQSGRLSLSSASQLQNFFEKQKKTGLKKEKALEDSKSLKSESPVQGIFLQNLRREELEKSAPRRTGEESRSLESSGGSQESRQSEESAGSSCLISQTGATPAFFSFEKTEADKEKIREEKESALSRSQKLDLIEKAEGRSSRETEKLLLERLPESEKPLARREQARPLRNGQVEIKAIVSDNCHKKLKELKNLLSHRNPSMEYGGLLEILSDLALEKYDPLRKGKRRAKGGQDSDSVGSRKREAAGGASQLAASAPKLKSSPRAPVDSTASLPRLRRLAKTPDASAPKRRQTAHNPSTSARKSQQTRQTSVFAGGKGRRPDRAFGATIAKPKQTKQDPVVFATTAAKSNRTNPSFAASALKQSQEAESPRASAQKSRQASRYIPAAVKRQVWARDKGCCSYVNPQTGRKCESHRFLHIDHILPFALGGGSGADNLRLLCAGHNQFRARQTFKSDSFRKR